MLQHVTRSRGWNITERVNGNIGNEIQLGMEIPMIKSLILQVSQKQMEYDINICGSTMKDLDRRVMSGVFPNHRVINLRVR
jgi:hypothetical protein